MVIRALKESPLPPDGGFSGGGVGAHSLILRRMIHYYDYLY